MTIMTNVTKIRIGTRKSPLALVQAGAVRVKLESAWPGLACDLVPIITSGDKFTDKPLADIGGKALFTKEIEEALLDNRIEIAVHSMKDMPTVLPDGLIIGCMLKREDPRDMLIGPGISSIQDMPNGANFGTSSLRRAAQMLLLRPDIKIVPLRGNVGTRLAKLEKKEMHATMLAVAGLKRLGLEVPGCILAADVFLPAIAQGAIGVECRDDNTKIRDLLMPLSHLPTEQAVSCERAFLRMLNGSCRTPIAGYAHIQNEQLHFNGLIAKPDGSDHHRVSIQGIASDAERLGENAGMELAAKTGKGYCD